MIEPRSPETFYAPAPVTVEKILEMTASHQGIFDCYRLYQQDDAGNITQPTVEQFALHQNLGFPEDFLTAISQGQEAYTSFLTQGVKNSPGVLRDCPSLLSSIQDKDVRDYAINFNLMHRYTFTNPDAMAGFVDPEVLQRYLRSKSEHLHATYLNIPTVVRWMRAGFDDTSLMRRMIKKGLEENMFFWQINATPSEFDRQRQITKDKEERRVLKDQHESEYIDMLDEATEAELVTWDDIEASLIKRSTLAGMRSISSHHGEAITQFSSDAHMVLSALVKRGKIKMSVTDFIQHTNSLETDLWASGRMGHIFNIEDARYNDLTPDDAFKLAVIDGLDDRNNPSLVASKYLAYKAAGRAEEATLLEAWLVEIIRANGGIVWRGQSWHLTTAATDIALTSSLFSEDERQKFLLEMAKDEKQATIRGSDQVTWQAPANLEELQRLIQEDLDTMWAASLPHAHLEECAEYLNWSPVKMALWLLRRCRNEGCEGLLGLDDYAQQIAEGSLKLPLSAEDIYGVALDIVINNIDQYEVNGASNYRNRMSSLTKILRVFGKAMAVRFIQEVQAVSSAAAMVISAELYDVAGTVEQNVLELMGEDDYYCYKTLAYEIVNIYKYCDPQVTHDLLDKIINIFDAADLNDVGHLLAGHLTPEQLEKLDRKIAINPAEYEEWHAFKQTLPYFYEELKALPPPGERHNPLEIHAPKSYQHLMRRLMGRIASDRSGLKLLAQYGYQHQLASEISELLDANTCEQLYSDYRAKNEKAELERLEIVYVAAKYGRIDSLLNANPRKRPEIITDVLSEPLKAIGLEPDTVTSLIKHVQASGMHLAPLVMWVEQSRRSSIMSDYMRNFLRHYATTGSLVEWKLSHSHALLDKLSQEVRAQWFQGRQLQTNIGGEQASVRVTHDLDAVYMVGAKPSVNCLHYGHGTNKHGLGDLLNPHVAVVEVRNAKNNVQANAILRVVGQAAGGHALLMEPIYDSYTDYFTKRETYSLITHMLLEFAESMGLPLVLGGHSHANNDYQTLVSGFVDTETPEGTRSTGKVSVYAGTAPFSYGDATGMIKKSQQVSVRRVARKALVQTVSS